MQFLGLASLAAIVGVAGVSAATTLRGNRGTSETSEGSVVTDAGSTSRVAKAPVSKPVVVQQAAPAPTIPTPAVESAPAPVTVAVKPAPHGGFVIVEGRTQLADSIYATRSGDSVIVNFDAYGFRTRRSAKFEQSLRLTLPMLFGKMATASVDTVAAGALVPNRDLIGSLAGEGMRLTLDNGTTARIRVLTRVVSDGPIVIGYLTTIER